MSANGIPGLGSRLPAKAPLEGGSRLLAYDPLTVPIEGGGKVLPERTTLPEDRVAAPELCGTESRTEHLCFPPLLTKPWAPVVQS